MDSEAEQRNIFQNEENEEIELTRDKFSEGFFAN